MWVVGLGNPGRRYAGTRHNVGHEVLGRLVARWQAAPLLRERSFAAFRSAEPAVTLIEPLAYMNRSGAALAAFAAASGERPDPARTLVVCDDIHLPVGLLRVRERGSTGGHRGLASVEQFFGTADYARLRVGVGAADGEDLVEHVLSGFDERDRDAIAEALERAADAVEIWAREGILAAMNRCNRRAREVSP